MARGKFITLEGGEGAGKSTHLAALAPRLRAAGLEVVVTREPGGTPGAEEIRRLLVEGPVARWEPETEALLHYAARMEHVAKVIRPALAAGRWVISDRFADSTLAYQGYGHGLDRAWIARLDALMLGGFRPDLTVILDLPVKTGLARAAARRKGGNRYEQMARVFHARVRKGFRAIARREPKRCVLIDASRDLDAVRRAIFNAVAHRLRIDLE
ncbi:MAG: dTMP kinase [Rhodospirillales bacterium]|nr:dTMP kinase [Rhodospirillales bacterium]